MRPRRITIVTRALLGYVRTGGAGTATTFLALALSRMGHRVDVLYVGEPSAGTLAAEWARLYRGTGVSIRVVRFGPDNIEPSRFGRMSAVEAALRDDPPDVVIAHELTAPAYTCLRLRQLGLAFADTLFVVVCHGTRLWAKEVIRNERVSADVILEAALERASAELADIVVSPSAYLVSWMQAQGWHLPDRTFVIPYVTRSGATGVQTLTVPRNSDGIVRRLVFFGRVEVRKGLELFVGALNALEPELLANVELEFLGRSSPDWPPDRVNALLSEPVSRALLRISFETELDQHEALDRLRRPGTLTVIPSLGDNSPNTVYECLESGIPFIASSVGGIPELIAPEDRARVLFEPTAEGLENALRRALSQEHAWQPPRAAFEAAASLERWAEVLATPAHKPVPPPAQTPVDVIVVCRGSAASLSRCLAALKRQRYIHFGVILVLAGPNVERPEVRDGTVVVRSKQGSVEAAREAGLRKATSPWVVFLDEEDLPEDEFLETLVRAQAASGADVVTCGIYLRHGEDGATAHFFLGEPRALGLLGNSYGNTSLIRRAVLRDAAVTWRAVGDPDWPLLADLSASGARIVSVPRPLVTRSAHPGTLDQQPADALVIVQKLEQVLPGPLRSLARLTAGLAESQRQRR